jgi:hypothetical protein
MILLNRVILGDHRAARGCGCAAASRLRRSGQLATAATPSGVTSRLEYPEIGGRRK